MLTRSLQGIGIALIVAAIAIAPEITAAGEPVTSGAQPAQEKLAFADGQVSAFAKFRTASATTSTRKATMSIVGGSLVVRARGVSRHFDLADILPIASSSVILSERPNVCRTSTALSRRGRYLVIEAILLGKGCAAIAAFVDLDGGRVAQEALLDLAWLHRSGGRFYRTFGTPVQVESIDRVFPQQLSLAADGETLRLSNWPFLVVRCKDARGTITSFAVDCADRVGRAFCVAPFHRRRTAILDFRKNVAVQYSGELFAGQVVVRPTTANRP